MGDTMGVRIRARRQQKGMTQQDLAVAVGVALTQVYRWESDLAEPSLSSVRALARALETSLEELIGAADGP